MIRWANHSLEFWVHQFQERLEGQKDSFRDWGEDRFIKNGHFLCLLLFFKQSAVQSFKPV